MIFRRGAVDTARPHAYNTMKWIEWRRGFAAWGAVGRQHTCSSPRFFIGGICMDKNATSYAMRVSLITLIMNIALSAGKLFAGIFASSSAMVSDAIHSASDALSTIAVMVGLKLAGRKSDRDHQYGHERIESVAALILAGMLIITGAGIGYSSIMLIVSGAEGHTPGVLALIAAAVSIVVKEGMYWYTRHAAKAISSGALMADAWHHRSDALSSVGSFIGILGSRLGFPVLDSVACIVICIFIIKAAYDIFKDAINKMTDHACDDATTGKIRQIILEQEDVRGIDLLRTRLFGDKIYVEVEISVDCDATLQDSHSIAHTVHDAIETQLQNVKHCMVHVNPQTKGGH